MKTNDEHLPPLNEQQYLALRLLIGWKLKHFLSELLDQTESIPSGVAVPVCTNDQTGESGH